MLQSSSGQKWKKCEQTLLIIVHYWGYTSLEVKGWWGLLFPYCLHNTAVQQPGTSSPPSWLKRSSKGIIWVCRASFTNSSCPLPWFSTVVSSQWIGWWLSHACSATADFSITPLSQASRCSVSSPVSVWSLQCRPGRSCRGSNITHWIAYQEVMYPSIWSTLSDVAGPLWWGGSNRRAILTNLPRLKDYSDVKLPTNTPDVLTHPSHIGCYPHIIYKPQSAMGRPGLVDPHINNVNKFISALLLHTSNTSTKIMFSFFCQGFFN